MAKTRWWDRLRGRGLDPGPQVPIPLYSLAGSTLGAPYESLETVLAWLRSVGANGLEARCGEGQPVHVGLSRDERRDIRATFRKSHVKLIGLSSYVKVCADGDDDMAAEDLRRHLKLAADLGTRHVRVFPGAPAEGPRDAPPTLAGDVDEFNQRAARRLAAVTPYAQAVGVWPLLETHDSHPRGEDVSRLLQAIAKHAPENRIGVIWDIAHPWRTGESPTQTWDYLGRWLAHGRGYVQIKDCVSRSDNTPRLQGQGAVPLPEVLQVLASGGYTGPLSLEWEKAWYPEVETLDLALDAAARSLRGLATKAEPKGARWAAD